MSLVWWECPDCHELVCNEPPTISPPVCRKCSRRMKRNSDPHSPV